MPVQPCANSELSRVSAFFGNPGLTAKITLGSRQNIFQGSQPKHDAVPQSIAAPPASQVASLREQGRRFVCVGVVLSASQLRSVGTVLWDARDVAVYFKVSRSWVYRAAETGRIPCVRVLGSLLRFEPDAIKAILGKGR